MKKLLLILVLSLHMMVVKASDFNTYLSGQKTVNPNGTVKITIGVNNASDLYGLSADIEYDHDKLELVENNGLNGFNLTCGSNKIVLDSATSKSGNYQLASLTFLASSSFNAGESTTVIVKSVEGGNGDELFSGKESSIVITAMNPKDGNNKLGSLVIENYDIGFNPDTNVYYLKVDNKTEMITISALSDSTTAKVAGTGTFPLDVYDNNFQITVTAENGEENTYQLIVSRADEEGKYSILNSPLLNVLSIDGYVINFKSNKFNYSIEIDDEVEDLNIFAFSQMEEYKVVIDKPEKLVIGENVVKIHVTDEEGNESIYTIDVFKKENSTANVNEDKKMTKSMIFFVIFLIEIFAIGFLIGYIFGKKKNPRVKNQ